MKVATEQSLRRELAFLYQVAQSVHSLEIEELLQEIVQIALQVTQADACLVYTFDSKRKQLILRASKHTNSQFIKTIKMKLGEGITGWVALHHRVVALSQKAYTDPRFKTFRDLPEDKYEAFLSVPIITKRGVVGVINAQHRLNHKHSEAEINLLTAIGKLVGGAVENALLVEETLVLKEALELRKVVEKAKGILMKTAALDEAKAYAVLQHKSMESGKSLKEIAEAILITQDLKLGY